MSLTDDLYNTGFPGGMFNSGFAGTWLAQRVADAKPAPQGGQTYAKVLIAEGDTQCLANQALHGQTQNVDALLGRGQPPGAFALHTEGPRHLGEEGAGAGLPLRRLPGRADRGSVAGHHRRPHRRSSRLGHHRQRHPRRLARPGHHHPVARVPRHLRGRQGADRRRRCSPPSHPSSTPGWRTLPRRRCRRSSTRTSRTSPPPAPRSKNSRECGSSSTTVAAAQVPGALQPVWSEDFTLVAAAIGTGDDVAARAGRDPRSSHTRRRVGLVQARPLGPAGHHPASERQPVGGPPALRLGAGHRRPTGLGFISAPLTHDLVVVGPASLDLWVKSTAGRHRPPGARSPRSDPTGRSCSSRPASYGRATGRSSRRVDGDPSGAHLPRVHRRATSPRQVHAGADSDPPLRLRIPRRIADPGDRSPRPAVNGRCGLSPPTRRTATVTDTVGLGGATPSALVLSVVPGITPPDRAARLPFAARPAMQELRAGGQRRLERLATAAERPRMESAFESATGVTPVRASAGTATRRRIDEGWNLRPLPQGGVVTRHGRTGDGQRARPARAVLAHAAHRVRRPG